MSVGFAVRSLGAETSPDAVLELAESLDVRTVAFDRPPSETEAWRRSLKRGVVEVAAVDAVADGGGIPAAVEAAATLRAHCVRLDVGATGVPAEEREAAREALVDRVVRGLHPVVTSGVPVAVRVGRGADDLLLPEELGWVLSELPALRVWFDGARAARLADGSFIQSPAHLAEQVASRCVGVTVSGGAGGGHPEDDGPDWSTLVATLPRKADWIVDLDPDLGRGALADAVRVTKSWFAG